MHTIWLLVIPTITLLFSPIYITITHLYHKKHTFYIEGGVFYLSFKNFETRIDLVIPITKGRNPQETIRVNEINLVADPIEIRHELYRAIIRLKEEAIQRIINRRQEFQGRKYKYLPRALIFKLYKNTGHNFELIAQLKIDRVTGELY